MTDLQAFPLAIAALPELALALARAGLPTDDIAEPGRVFLRFQNALGETIGFGGLEIHGESALLRSIIVMPEYRCNGWGQAILEQLNDHARDAGADHAYVLTISAQGFFEARGFAPVTRNEIPPGIQATRQVTGLCPASAVILVKALGQ